MLFETSSEVNDNNMEVAAKELHSISNNNRDIKSTGVIFDCTWNSRRWQDKEGDVAAIAQKTGKIIDIVRRTSYCRDRQKKKTLETITK